MTTFLLDANLSPKIADHLHGTLGLDVDSLVRRGIQHLSDEEVVVLAKEEKRVIITLDKDCGESYFLRERGRMGVIVLRLSDQRTVIVTAVLERFLRDISDVDLQSSLVVIGDTRTRIVRVE